MEDNASIQFHSLSVAPFVIVECGFTLLTHDCLHVFFGLIVDLPSV